MKQQWAPQELIDHWILTHEETKLVATISKTDYNRLGCALLLKYFQIEGKFPQSKKDIPSVIIEHVAQQLQIKVTVLTLYDLRKLVAKRHRVQVRKFIGIRMGTVTDANAVLSWLGTQKQLLEEHKFDRLKEIVYERYKELKIEPPQPGRIDRIIRSALNWGGSSEAVTTRKVAKSPQIHSLVVSCTSSRYSGFTPHFFRSPKGVSSSPERSINEVEIPDETHVGY